jgi:hypothetical protein
MVVTPELVITMDSLDDFGMGFGNHHVTHLAMSSFPSTYRVGVPFMMDDRISMRSAPVSVEVVEKSAQDLSKLMEADKPDSLQLVDLFLKASKSY